MADRQKAVEVLARALARKNGFSLEHYTKNGGIDARVANDVRYEATALLDQIAPILTADLQARLDAAEADKRAAVLDEREACARLIEGFRQERNHIGDQKCAALFRKAYAAIRARGDA